MKSFIFLKSKLGDFKSILELNEREAVPFFDLVSTNSGLDGEELEVKILKFIGSLEKSWDQEDLVFIDHFDVSLDARLPSGQHPYSLYGDLLDKGYNVGLVTGIDRDEDYQDEVFAILDRNPNASVAIRMLLEDIQVPRLILSELSAIYGELSARTQDIFLVFDCRVISNQDEVAETVSSIKNFLPRIQDDFGFTAVVVTSSSIPQELNELVKTGESVELARNEVAIWSGISDEESQIFIYGDYGTVSPDYIEIDSSGPLPIVPKVVYTFDDRYWIQRGKITSQHPLGFKQYRVLAEEVINHPEYRGKSFSSGDGYIYKIATATAVTGSTGNATTWITAGMNQHINYVLSEF